MDRDKIIDIVNNIYNLIEVYSSLSNGDLYRKHIKLTENIKNIQDLYNVENIIESFSLICEVINRSLDISIYKSQITGAVNLHFGNIIEMGTGEGKTYTAMISLYLNTFKGNCIVVTTNDYLTNRDYMLARKVFSKIKIQVGRILSTDNKEIRKQNYNKNICYCTPHELGFDYLRDKQVYSIKDKVLPKNLHYCIIDEIDNILLDEATMPLVISLSNPIDTKCDFEETYISLDNLFSEVENGVDYDILGQELVEVSYDGQSVNITDFCIDLIERRFGLVNLYTIENSNLLKQIDNYVVANYVLKDGRDYIVKDNQICLINKFTGRLSSSKQLSNGLHQTLQKKEGLEITHRFTQRNSTNYYHLFSIFNKISGMSGTILSHRDEMMEHYNKCVIKIEPNNASKRYDNDLRLYNTKQEKLTAIITSISDSILNGQPVLVGVNDEEDILRLSLALSKLKINYNLLDADNIEEEIEIIKTAGIPSNITIATSIAGRGTDINLPRQSLRNGGLKVICYELSHSVRVDNQFKGRAGRQGEIGETEIYSCFDDNIFSGREEIENLRNRRTQSKDKNLGYINNKSIIRRVKAIQIDADYSMYKIRDNSYKFDKIINRNFELFFEQRDLILECKSIYDLYNNYILDILDNYLYKELSYFKKEYIDSTELKILKNLFSFIPNTLVDKDIPIKTEIIKNLIENWIKDILNIGTDSNIVFNSIIRKHLNIENKLLTKENKNTYLLNTNTRKHDLHFENLLKNILRIIDNNWVLYLDKIECHKINLQFISYKNKDILIDHESRVHHILERTNKDIQLQIILFITKILGGGKN